MMITIPLHELATDGFGFVHARFTTIADDAGRVLFSFDGREWIVDAFLHVVFQKLGVLGDASGIDCGDRTAGARLVPRAMGISHRPDGWSSSNSNSGEFGVRRVVGGGAGGRSDKKFGVVALHAHDFHVFLDADHAVGGRSDFAGGGEASV